MCLVGRETYEYDDIDRLVKTINPIGNVITVQTDYRGKVDMTTTSGQDGVTSHLPKQR